MSNVTDMTDRPDSGKSSGRLLLQVSIFYWLTCLVIRVPQFVDLMYAGKIGVEYVGLVAMLGFLIIPFQIGGQSITNAWLVLNRKQKKSLASINLHQSGKSFVLLSAIFCLPLLFLVAELTMNTVLVEASNLRTLVALNLGLGATLLMVQFLRNTLIADDRMKLVLWVEGLGILVNIICKEAGLSIWANDPQTGLVVISLASMVGQVFVLAVLYVLVSQQWGWGYQAPQLFFKRAQSALSGEALLSTFLISEPFVFSMVFSLLGSSDVLASYNLGYRVMNFSATAIYASIAFGGVAWLAKSWERRNSQTWDYRLSAIQRASWAFAFPILVLGFSAPIWLQSVFGLVGPAGAWVGALVILSGVGNALTTQWICEFRIFERPKWVSLSSFVSIYVVGLPVTFLLVRLDAPIWAASLGILLPTVLRAVILSYLIAKLRESVRIDTNFAISETEGFKLRISEHNGRPKNIEYFLSDLGTTSCAINIQSDTRSTGFRRGDRLKVDLISNHLSTNDVTVTVSRVLDYKLDELLRTQETRIILQFDTRQDSFFFSAVTASAVNSAG
jgi:hypothetical protein